MSAETHIMIDLETLSNRPQTGVIMAMAAVKFDPYEGPLVECRKEFAPLPMENTQTENELYIIIDVSNSVVEHGYQIERETLEWWIQGERQQIYAQMIGCPKTMPIVKAMMLLTAFAAPTSDIKPYGWSHGAVYDMVFVAERYQQLFIPNVNPFDHHNVMDTRTLLKTHRDVLGYDVVWPEPQMKHHPLDDARRQAYVVQLAMRGLRELTGRGN